MFNVYEELLDKIISETIISSSIMNSNDQFLRKKS